jgi:LiaF transmembrane domain
VSTNTRVPRSRGLGNRRLAAVAVPAENPGMANRSMLSGRVVIGILLVIVGGLFLLDASFDFDVGGFFSTFWPLFLIGFGLWATVESRGRNIVGLVVLLLGLGFQAARLDWIPDDWIGKWGWPLILIAIGLWFILARPLAGRGEQAKNRSDEWFDEFAMFGGRKVQVRSKAWRGGEATAIMGGIELDLRDATPVPEGATVDVTAFMGGVDLFVPRTWVVTVKGIPLLGSVEDHTVVSAETDETRNPDPALPRLHVRATAVMGGVEIKH